MIPRVHVGDNGGERKSLPPAVAWTIIGFMVLLTISGSAIGAAATLGVGVGPLVVVLGAMLLIAAAVMLAPRVARARR